MPKRVGILTGGGDCPGLNAVIRAVVRKADALGWESLGILEGWRGLLENKIERLDLARVSGILYRGGTILRTSRTNPLKRPNGLDLLRENIARHGMDAPDRGRRRRYDERRRPALSAGGPCRGDSQDD